MRVFKFNAICELFRLKKEKYIPKIHNKIRRKCAQFAQDKNYGKTD